MRLSASTARERDQFEIMDASAATSCRRSRADLRTSVQPVATIGGGGAQNADVQFLINGPDLKALETIGQQLVEQVEDDARASSTSTRR